MAVSGRDRAGSPDEPRDPALDRAYAAGAREEPPPHLDAAILAAARRQAHAGPRPRGAFLRDWRAPVALAAVLLLSLTVVLLMREEGGDRLAESTFPQAPSVSSEGKSSADKRSPAESDRRPQTKAPPIAVPEVAQPAPPKDGTRPLLRDAPASGVTAGEEYRRKEENAAASRQEADRREAPGPTPRPFAEPSSEPKLSAPEPSPPAGALAKRALPGLASGQAMERAEREQQPAQRAPAPPAAAAPEAPTAGTASPPTRADGPAASDSSAKAQIQERTRNAATDSRPAWQGYEAQPPEKWLERVEELHRAGRSDEAREMLAEFRKRFPQYPVPARLNR